MDGTVTATSSDAINGSQLYDLSSNHRHLSSVAMLL
ncbi:hypothetical protein QT341_23585 [Escherichia coli]|nr:hypothetical protein [Escherichia coli]